MLLIIDIKDIFSLSGLILLFCWEKTYIPEKYALEVATVKVCKLLT